MLTSRCGPGFNPRLPPLSSLLSPPSPPPPLTLPPLTRGNLLREAISRTTPRLPLSQSGLGDTNLGEGATPFCVTGPRDGDGIIVLIRGVQTGAAAALTHPRPVSIWWEADNESVNVLCPSARDTQYGR